MELDAPPTYEANGSTDVGVEVAAGSVDVGFGLCAGRPPRQVAVQDGLTDQDLQTKAHLCLCKTSPVADTIYVNRSSTDR